MPLTLQDLMWSDQLNLEFERFWSIWIAISGMCRTTRIQSLNDVFVLVNSIPLRTLIRISRYLMQNNLFNKK